METVETVNAEESLDVFANKIVSEINATNEPSEEKPKRKRGRPRGSKSAKAQQATPVETQKDNTEEIAFLSTLFFQTGTIITTATKTRAYTPDEAQMLATAAMPVIEKYGGTLSPEWALVAVGLMQIGPRYLESMQAKAKRERQAWDLERAEQ